MRCRKIVTLVLLAAWLTPPALACSPLAPPYPPAPPAGTSKADADALADAWRQGWWTQDAEAERARTLARQVELADKAEGILVARIDRTGRTSGAPPELSFANNLPMVFLQPVRWLRGEGALAEFQLAYEMPGPCRMMPDYDALRGSPGEVFIVYLGKPSLDQLHVLDAVAVKRIIEPRVLRMLTGREIPAAPQ